jgi:transposase-like protein
MLHRIRLALQNGSIVKLHGQVEVDESWIGGKARSMNNKRRATAKINTVGKVMDMTPVQGLLMRHKGGASKIILRQIKSTHKSEVQGNIREYVLKGSEVFTDELRSYRGVGKDYVHQVINHAECYAKGKVHTNGLENFWSLLKRGIRGTYVSVEPFHLFRYLDEQAFRFNERKDSDAGRFMTAVKGILGRGLKYVDLIGKGGDDLQQTVA